MSTYPYNGFNYKVYKKSDGQEFIRVKKRTVYIQSLAPVRHEEKKEEKKECECEEPSDYEVMGKTGRRSDSPGKARGDATCRNGKQGLRPHMEDESAVGSDSKGWRVYIVMDGHGGKEYAQELKKRLPDALTSSVAAYKPHQYKAIKAAIENACDRIDDKIHREHPRWDSGSAVIALLRNGPHAYVANIGDSRVVIFSGDGRLIFASRDQKPDDPKEKKRIEDAGGTVSPADAFDVARTNGYLAMSRSFGDWSLKRVMKPGHAAPLIATPVVSYIYLSNKNAKRKASLKKKMFSLTSESSMYAVLASDGVWDVLSNKRVVRECVDYMKEKDTFQGICSHITDLALRKGSDDNVTALFVKLCM